MRNPPQTINDILTLFMDEPAMKKYSLESYNSDNQALQVQESPWTPQLVQSALSACLDEINNSDTGSKEFRLRLATSNDLATVTRLIQGLADYVNESHEVHSTSEDYLRDGFSNDPLFFCLLVDRIMVGDNQGNGEAENKNSVTYYTCGYAAVYFGYVLGEGRFLYLEDLFLEVEHRKSGGGSLVMKTLARIALTLQCSRLYWQALDWNTSALQFYNSMGATVQEGVVMTRYCGTSLKEFAAHGNET
jgi:GNAT superfamily N-acetyltransferase